MATMNEFIILKEKVRAIVFGKLPCKMNNTIDRFFSLFYFMIGLLIIIITIQLI